MNPRKPILPILAAKALLLVLQTGLQAQLPDGWYATCSFQRGALSQPGAILFVHPRSGAQWSPVSGLGCELTGACAPGVFQGANCILHRRDGALIVGETGPSGAQIDLHVLTLSGTLLQSDLRYPVGTASSASTLHEIAQCAFVPGTGAPQDILVSVHGLTSGGALNGEALGIVRPRLGPPGTPGTVAAIPVPVLRGLTVNALAVDPSGSRAYAGVFHSNGLSDIYAVPLPANGAAQLLATLPAGVSSLAIDNRGQLIAACLGGPPNLFAIDVASGALTPDLSWTHGAINSLAIETATGNHVMTTGGQGTPPGALYWMPPGGQPSLLLSLGRGVHGAKSGVAINPNPEAFGTSTSGSHTYSWQLAPNPGGLPLVGNSAFSLTVNANPGPIPPIGFWWLDFVPLSNPLPAFGVDLWALPKISGSLVPDPGNPSRATLSLPIPNVLYLAQTPLYLQGAFVEATAPLTLGSTEGLAMSIL